MILLLFLLLAIVAIGILAMRRQSYFQHREMMRALNPEKMAKIEAEERAGTDRLIKVFLIVLGFFGLLFLFALLGTCQFKGFIPDSPKIESSEPAPNLDPLKPNPGTFPNSK